MFPAKNLGVDEEGVKLAAPEYADSLDGDDLQKINNFRNQFKKWVSNFFRRKVSDINKIPITIVHFLLVYFDNL
jgi:hypothetical protein